MMMWVFVEIDRRSANQQMRSKAEVVAPGACRSVWLGAEACTRGDSQKFILFAYLLICLC